MSKPDFQSRQEFVKPAESEFNDPLGYYLKTVVSPGVSVNWIVFWNGAHAHFLATVGRVANEFKGIEVKPRAEHPGELPEEPDTASMTAKERETAMAEHKMALDKYWRMNAVYAPQAEKLLDARNQIVQDLLSTRVKFEITQYLEEVKGAEALYSDKTTLPDIKEWIQDACLRQGGRDNRELKKIAKEQKQRLDTEGSMLKSETLTDLLHKCKGIQNTYNAAYTSEHEQLKDSDMVDIFHTALDPERYNEYKVYLENRRRQKPRANATEEQIAQFMFNLNLPMNLQEIYDECKGYQYCEKPPMPNIMAAEKATKGKGNGTKPQKPSDAVDKVEGEHEDRKCYKCGVLGHIAINCSEGKATNKKKSDSQPAVQPTQPIVNPMVQAPLHNVYPIGVPPPWMGGGGPQPYPHMLYPNMIYHGMGYPPPATGMAQGSYQGSDILPPQTVLTQSDDEDDPSEEFNFAMIRVEPEKENHSILAHRDREDKWMAERLLQTEKDERLVAEKLRTESAARELAEMKLVEMEQRFKEMEKEHVAEKAERLRLRKEKAALAKQKKEEKKAALATQKKHEEKTALDKKETELELTKMNTVHGTLEEEEFDSVGAHLISRGFKRSNSNNWYFVKQFGHDQMDVRDDDRATYNDKADLNQLLKGLKEKFKIQCNSLKIQEGSILDHLDIHFSYDKEGQENVSITPFTQKLGQRNEQICKKTADIFKVG